MDPADTAARPGTGLRSSKMATGRTLSFAIYATRIKQKTPPDVTSSASAMSNGAPMTSDADRHPRLSPMAPSVDGNNAGGVRRQKDARVAIALTP